MRGQTRPIAVIAGLLLATGAACSSDAPPADTLQEGLEEVGGPIATEEFSVTSSAFEHGDTIPFEYSSYGESISPALNWSNLPEGTRSIALIQDDETDAPRRFVHWVVYNIPATATGLPEGITEEGALTSPADLAGTVQGINGMRRARYYGPQPPRTDPPHHYHFTLYALSLEPNLPEGLNAAELREAMEGNILGEALLIGVFDAPAEE